MPAVRAAAARRRGLLLAVVLQVAVFSAFVASTAWCPNLALLVVVAAALVARPASSPRCSASSPAWLLDLAPPADHVAGRWALALVVVGYLAGRVRQDAGTSARRRGGHRRGLLVRGHLGLRAQRRCCCTTPRSRSARRCG